MWLREITELLYEMSDADFEMVKGLGYDSYGSEEIADANECVRIISGLLNDGDGDVRDAVLTRIRFRRISKRRRPLKPEDFPEIYKEAQEMDFDPYLYGR